MITQQEFDDILANSTKRIDQDIRWSHDPDHSPAWEFRVEVRSDNQWPIFIVGRWNPSAGTLSYVVIHRSAGRIYGLDLGADHHNPTCERVGEEHKHTWTEGFRDKQAYVPDDITAPWDQPVDVWQQFCREFNIVHNGKMYSPVVQKVLPL